MKKKIYLLVSVIVLIIVLAVLYNTSFVKIQINNERPSVGVSYVFVSQKGGVTNASSNPGIFKKRLPRGRFTIEVMQGDQSHIAEATTRGFFSTVTINANFQTESKRSFVGNNPSTCMSYPSNVLVSFVCGDSYLSAKIHVPANGNLPTYTVSPEGYLVNGIAVDSVNTNEGALVLVKAITDAGAGSYTIYSVDSGFHPLKSIALSQTDPSKNYHLTAYRDGFIVYDDTYSQALYYPSLNSKPQNILLPPSPANNLKPSAISFDPNSNQVMLLFTGNVNNGHSEAFIGSGVNFKQYTFRQDYTSAAFCGTQICLLQNNKILDFYNLGQDKATLSFSIGGVQAIKTIDDSLLIVNQQGIVRFDASTMSGYFDYSFGDYKYCGMQQASSSSYILCLKNTKGDTVAIMVDSAFPDSDSIDKKVAQLLKQPEITDVSAYGHFLYIAPNLGQMQNLSGGGVGYDPAIIKKVDDEINAAVKQIGIDTKVYKIVNPYD